MSGGAKGFQQTCIIGILRTNYIKLSITCIGPGLFFVLPCIDTIQTIDLRTITMDIPPQEILTRDSVTVTVDAVVYFRIFDAVRSVNKVSNPQYSTKLLAATSLRNILGTKALSEILTDKEQIAHNLQVRHSKTRQNKKYNFNVSA